ncbi:MAG: hypothetical protein ACJ76H_12415 [Bacteriovoracaceae bacterium]
MQTTQGTELVVAILMDDLSGAKEISTALRTLDIFAHHYQSLEEFWGASQIGLPDLLIVDVTKMSQGPVQFRNHPKVKDGTLNYAFYSKDSTKILLQSTLGLRPVGYLNQDISLNSQVRGMVETLAGEKAKNAEMHELRQKVERIQSRSQRLISERTAAEEFISHYEYIRNLCAEIEKEATTTDFSMSLLNRLENWESIDGYGIYELNQSGQKLVAPEVTKKKFHPFPSLWLGQANNYGIEQFAQDMAIQVANDLFEVEPVSIRIFGASHLPDMLLYVSFKEERMMNFPWDVLESSLSSSLRKIRLQRDVPQYQSQFMPMWEALDTMDRMQKDTIDADLRIMALSLVPLTDAAKRRTGNKFYWSAFFNDFFLQLSGRLQKSTKLSLMGPWHVVFFIPKENVESETRMLQTFMKQFGFWKFFEDNTQVLTEDMMPSLKLLPPSSSHYFRGFEREFEELKVRAEEKRLMTQARSERKLTV